MLRFAGVSLARFRKLALTPTLSRTRERGKKRARVKGKHGRMA
jgi:hypothetical protein